MTTILMLFLLSLVAFIIYRFSKGRIPSWLKQNGESDGSNSGNSDNGNSDSGQLARLTLVTNGWPSAIKIKSASRSNETYLVNLSKQSCQCPNFMEERRRFKLGDPRRFCKHMVKAVMQNSSKQKLPKVVHKLFSDADHAGKGLYFDEYKIVTINGRDVIISESSDLSWYAVILEKDGDAVRYSYNPLELRWAYNREPKDADKFIKLIDGWS